MNTFKFDVSDPDKNGKVTIETDVDGVSLVYCAIEFMDAMIKRSTVDPLAAVVCYSQLNELKEHADSNYQKTLRERMKQWN